MFTCIGMFTSDSGNESILKLVCERNGLSGMIRLEHDAMVNDNKTKLINPGFKELNMP